MPPRQRYRGRSCRKDAPRAQRPCNHATAATPPHLATKHAANPRTARRPHNPIKPQPIQSAAKPQRHQAEVQPARSSAANTEPLPKPDSGTIYQRIHPRKLHEPQDPEGPRPYRTNACATNVDRNQPRRPPQPIDVPQIARRSTRHQRRNTLGNDPTPSADRFGPKLAHPSRPTLTTPATIPTPLWPSSPGKH